MTNFIPGEKMLTWQSNILAGIVTSKRLGTLDEDILADDSKQVTPEMDYN